MIKALLFVFFFVCVSCFGSLAQCPDVPVLDRSAILASQEIPIDRAIEASYTLVAPSLGTSWSVKGAESAAVTIFVDGKYNQDLLLFSGTEGSPAGNVKRFEYKI